uniref:molybdate ABC transporter substrate-binding protein n=1 Tax=Dysosmobacter welbionis TaxID=2093857 RepID=UPI003FEF46C0
MKKLFSLVLALSMGLALTACSGSADTDSTTDDTTETTAEPVELHVFAAASMQESLDQVIEAYKAVAPEVAVVATYDSSGTLKTQIQEGADCDVFISAAPKQMNQLDAEGGEENTEGLDLVNSATRLDLLENKVTLAVPEGNPKGIESFDQLAELLASGDVFLAMGNSDVPVGQYTQKIFTYYGLNEETLASSGVLTYGSNVKEVTTQVSEGTVDCGVIYATDAFSAGLTVVDEATAEMCGQVIYPAAVMKNSANPDAAKAFLDFLSTDEAMACFEAVGFSPMV